MTDIEIARKAEKKEIEVLARELGLTSDQFECYGRNKAKIDPTKITTKQNLAKLILVTSIHPTPYGEGKTTVSIGINDALRRLGKKSLAVLREPSLGPVFGIKGGATGGGLAQVVPMEEINLHFTGDIHAVTACNNLLAAMIDNHLFQGNELNLDPSTIEFSRVMDMNDRALRSITLHSSYERDDHFMITTASEMMAILCLAENLEDLKARLGAILIGFTYDKKPVFARDLKGVDALVILLKDALKPNLVQSLEQNPILLHGGPFANIAHGCNSVIATKLGMNLADYVITEAGFGADLGALKFFDIKCRSAALKPDCVVINATIRSLKYNGGCPKEEISKPSLSYLQKGSGNLLRHIENMKFFSSNLLVCLNQFQEDSEKEIAYLKELCEQQKVPFARCASYLEGSQGATELAQQLLTLLEQPNQTATLYEVTEDIPTKIEKICKKLYRASTVVYSETAKNKMELYHNLGLDSLPICIAKTQYSFSDNPKLLGDPVDFTMTVTDLELRNGAGFIVVKMGSIMTMPGLSKNPAYLSMKIDDQGTISGLF